MDTASVAKQGQLFDDTAPPPPARYNRDSKGTYDEAAVLQAIEILKAKGFVAIYADEEAEARNLAKRLSRAVMLHPTWRPMFGEPRARYVGTSAKSNGQGWWGYAEINSGSFVEKSGSLVAQVDALGNRTRRVRRMKKAA